MAWPGKYLSDIEDELVAVKAELAELRGRESAE